MINKKLYQLDYIAKVTNSTPESEAKRGLRDEILLKNSLEFLSKIIPEKIKNLLNFLFPTPNILGCDIVDKKFIEISKNKITESDNIIIFNEELKIKNTNNNKKFKL